MNAGEKIRLTRENNKKGGLICPYTGFYAKQILS